MIEYYNSIVKKSQQIDNILFSRGVLPSTVFSMDWEEHHLIGLYNDHFSPQERINDIYMRLNAANPSEEYLQKIKTQETMLENKQDKSPAVRID